MIVPQQYKCDVCGRERTETNHWWVVIPTRSSNALETFYKVYRWADAACDGRLDSGCAYHFCGQTHVLQFLSGEMGKTETP